MRKLELRDLRILFKVGKHLKFKSKSSCNKDTLQLLISDNLREKYFVIGIFTSYYQNNDF